MKTISKVILFFAVFTMIACEKNEELPVNNDSDLLLGAWSKGVADDTHTCWTYTKVDSLEEDEYGFSFKSEDVFIERKNAGWCATPPIFYSNFDGSWARTDSIIDISVAYWGGMTDYQWKIISVDKQHLTINVIKTEDSSISVPLQGTAWKLAGYVDVQTGKMIEPEPEACEQCYTIEFETDGMGWAISVLNEIKVDLFQKPFFGAMTKIYDSHLGNAALFYETIRLLDSYSVKNEELRFYYNEKNNYLLYKPVTIVK